MNIYTKEYMIKTLGEIISFYQEENSNLAQVIEIGNEIELPYDLYISYCNKLKTIVNTRVSNSDQRVIKLFGMFINPDNKINLDIAEFNKLGDSILNEDRLKFPSLQFREFRGQFYMFEYK